MSPNQHRIAEEYLELAVAAELAWQDGRADSASRRVERLERKLATLLNWGPLRLLHTPEPNGGER